MSRSATAFKTALLAASLANALPVLAKADDANRVAAQVCAETVAGAGQAQLEDLRYKDRQWRIVDPQRLSYFLFTSTGRIGSVTEAQNLVRTLGSDESTMPGPLANAIEGLQRDLGAGKLEGLRSFNSTGTPVELSATSHNRFWVEDPGLTLRCLLPESDSAAEEAAPGPLSGRLRLRGNVDALTAEGDERTTADAASFGFQRVRSFLEDGTRKQVNIYTVNAVLGFVAIDNGRTGLMPYVSYELNRERTKPAPALVPPATLGDGDTDVLKLGLIASHHFRIAGTGNYNGGAPQRQEGKYGITVSLDGAYLFDFVKDSERLRGRVTTSLYTDENVLGLCGFGSLTTFADSSIWTLCELEGIVSVNALTKRGTLPVGTSDSFSHMGGRLAFTAYSGEPTKDGMFFNAEYVRLWRIDGSAIGVPDIRRHSFNLGYRWWNDDNFAFELKAQLIDGINPDSLADENSLSIGFGIIF